MRNCLTCLLAVVTVALCFIHPAAAGLCAVGAVTSYAFGDGNLKKTKAMPTGASAVTTDAIDLLTGTGGTFTDACELLISAPALTTGMLGDAATVKYDIVTSASSDLSGPTTIAATVLTQTGAGGAGAAAATKRFRLPTDCQRYVGVKATKSAAGDASSVSMTIALVF